MTKDRQKLVRVDRPSSEALAVAQEKLVALDREAEEAAERAVPPNTRRAYEFELACFVSWCARHGISPMPASPRVLRAYLFELSKEGRSQEDVPRGIPKGPLKYSSLVRALAAICTSHCESGHPSPWKDKFVEATRTMLASEKTVAVKKKTDLSSTGEELLLRVCELMSDSENLRHVRDRAMILVGWQGGGRRRSEIVGACADHFKPDGDSIRWTIPKSKTDQAGAGLVVALTPENNEAYCPVISLRKWLEVSKIEEGPVFRGIVGGKISETALTPEGVARRVQHYVKKLGLDPSEFGGHSIRSGFITSAVMEGISEADIMEATGHKSVAVMRGYVRRANLVESSAGRGLLGKALARRKESQK